MIALDERLQTEADLCHNEGADDIANLLDEAAAELNQLRVALDAAQKVVEYYVGNGSSETVGKEWLQKYGDLK